MIPEISAIILAAGRGRRLLPLTKDTPKCLIRVDGTPILHRQLDALQKYAIRDVSIITGFKASIVKEYAQKNFSDLNLNFVENLNHESTNTFYSLALAVQKIGSRAPLLLLNGDVVFHPKVIEAMVSGSPAKSFSAVVIKKCGIEEIKAKVDLDGRILNLNKSLNPDDCMGEAVGINLFNPEFLGSLRDRLVSCQDELRNEYFENAVEHVIQTAPHPLYARDISMYGSVEVDFPEDLKAAEDFIAGYI